MVKDRKGPFTSANLITYAFLAFIAFMAFFGAAAAAFAAFLAIFALKIKRGNLKNAKVTQDKFLEQYIIYVLYM